MRKVSISLVTSPSLSLIGFPASTQSAKASSSNLSVNRSTQCWRTFWRSKLAIRAIGSVASTQAAMPASIVAASACATRNATSPLNLSVTSRSVFGCFASLAR